MVSNWYVTQTFRLKYPRRGSPQKLSDYAWIDGLFSPLFPESGKLETFKYFETLQSNSPFKKKCTKNPFLLSKNGVFVGEMMFLGNGDRSKFQRVYEKFPKSSLLRNSEYFWRVFQKLSGFMCRV